MEHVITSSAFSSDLQFCSVCGTILPTPTPGQDIISCSRCPFKRHIKEYDDVVEEFVIHCNTPKKKHKNKSAGDRPGGLNTELGSAAESMGPTVERQCPRCHHDTMTYTTRQTRSADEGQTVFYTCVSCRFQDIEYS